MDNTSQDWTALEEAVRTYARVMCGDTAVGIVIQLQHFGTVRLPIRPERLAVRCAEPAPAAGVAASAKGGVARTVGEVESTVGGVAGAARVDRGEPVAPRELTRGRIAAGPEYRCVTWRGRQFLFSRKQALVIATLWQAAQNGTPDVPQEVLLRKAESDCARMADLFRRGNQYHEAWGVMLVTGGSPGTYRLTEMPDPPADDADGDRDGDDGTPAA